MPIKQSVKHTFMVCTPDGWKVIGEVPFTELGDISAYRLLQVEPISLETVSIRIDLDDSARFFEWWLEWTFQQVVPKISRT